MLGLQAEQEGGSEVIDAVDTGGVVARGHQLRIRKMFLLQVSMDPEENREQFISFRLRNINV